MLKCDSFVAPIPNIDLGRTFDLRYEDQDVHSESLGKLAAHFGRDMVAHRHDRIFQVHLLLSGQVRLHLDDQLYQARAPLFFVTPPAVTHAFVISDDAEGHVLSVRQQLIWRLFKSDPSHVMESVLSVPMCVELDPHQPETQRLLGFFDMIRHEFASTRIGRELNLVALTRLAFVEMARLSAQPVGSKSLRQVDVQLFQRFNQLIEDHYKQHWTLDRYAGELNITETRLNDICRRVADVASKRLVHERLLQEAKRQLMFSTVSISQIAYALGFRDSSYFSRFFRQHADSSPSGWRERALARQP